MISRKFQALKKKKKTRSATSTAEAWEILNVFVRRNTHNRIQIRRQVHEFKMEKGGNALEHLMKFEEICTRMAAIGDNLNQDEQIILLLGSLSDEYDSIVKIIENIPNMDMLQAKEMIQREYESLQRKESGEIALKATKQQFRKERQGNHKQRDRAAQKFNGKCFGCERTGHRIA